MSKEKDLEFVRAQLRKAAEIKDPRDMWYTIRDILNLLTLMIVPEPVLVTEESVSRPR